MTTRCIFIRHAKPQSDHMGDDFNKPLSDEGRDNLETLNKIFAEKEIETKLVFTSPLLRAVQTAEILAKEAPVIKEPALGALFDDDAILSLIQEHAGSTLFFVGHAPTLSEFTEKLVGENVLPQGLSKACAASVTFEGKIAYGQGSFKGVTNPFV